jgi:hypothetical protein
MQWGPLIPKGGVLIQVKIGGQPPLQLNHHGNCLFLLLVIYEPMEIMVLENHGICWDKNNNNE